MFMTSDEKEKPEAPETITPDEVINKKGETKDQESPVEPPADE